MGKIGPRGWSMSETILVVGIVAVLGAGVLSKFSATARQASVSAAAQDVKLMAGAEVTGQAPTARPDRRQDR